MAPVTDQSCQRTNFLLKRVKNTDWSNKDNHIKRETQDIVDDKTFKSTYGDNKPQTQKVSLCS